MPKDVVKSSGELTSDAVIRNGRCWLHGAMLISNGGTGTMTLKIYDKGSAGATGDLLTKVVLKGTDDTTDIVLSPVYASYGLYADVSGTSASYITYYAVN